MNLSLDLAISPCPNDTFSFHALVHGRVTAPEINWRVILADVETLNEAAREGTRAVTKLSFAALGHILDRYALLRSGAALGRGCGPLIVARPGADLNSIRTGPVAVPGLMTTARLLLGLRLPADVPVAPMPFDQIMPAVASGAYPAGVIIHEGRFTYPAHGLDCLLDLGQWWEAETGLPIPLGGIAIRRDLSAETALRVETAIRESVRYARTHPADSWPWVRRHAQEMAPDVIRRHIDLYVNDFTVDLGRSGATAVTALLARAADRGVIRPTDAALFATETGSAGAVGNPG